ncbi:MAG: hypothetical protein WC595_01195 [Candidatus Nanoarchaeia archaeon]
MKLPSLKKLLKKKPKTTLALTAIAAALLATYLSLDKDLKQATAELEPIRPTPAKTSTPSKIKTSTESYEDAIALIQKAEQLRKRIKTLSQQIKEFNEERKGRFFFLSSLSKNTDANLEKARSLNIVIKAISKYKQDRFDEWIRHLGNYDWGRIATDRFLSDEFIDLFEGEVSKEFMRELTQSMQDGYGRIKYSQAESDPPETLKHYIRGGHFGPKDFQDGGKSYFSQEIEARENESAKLTALKNQNEQLIRDITSSPQLAKILQDDLANLVTANLALSDYLTKLNETIELMKDTLFIISKF